VRAPESSPSHALNLWHTNQVAASENSLRCWLLPASVLILAGLSTLLCPILLSSQELVDDGSFEQSESEWAHGPPRNQALSVQIVNGTANSGLRSLSITGQGEGLYQELQKTAITSLQSTTWLQFYVQLERLENQNDPQALFQVYFIPQPNWPRYRIEIVVTLKDTGDTQGPPIDRSPGNVSGKIEYEFNRTPLNEWVPITLDLSNALRVYFPDYFSAEVTGILLGNSEGGRVYYDDVSVVSSSSVWQLPSFVYYFLADTSWGHFLSAFAGVIGFCYTAAKLVKFFQRIGKQSEAGKK